MKQVLVRDPQDPKKKRHAYVYTGEGTQPFCARYGRKFTFQFEFGSEVTCKRCLKKIQKTA